MQHYHKQQANTATVTTTLYMTSRHRLRLMFIFLLKRCICVFFFFKQMVGIPSDPPVFRHHEVGLPVLLVAVREGDVHEPLRPADVTSTGDESGSGVKRGWRASLTARRRGGLSACRLPLHTESPACSWRTCLWRRVWKRQAGFVRVGRRHWSRWLAFSISAWSTVDTSLSHLSPRFVSRATEANGHELFL